MLMFRSGKRLIETPEVGIIKCCTKEIKSLCASGLNNGSAQQSIQEVMIRAAADLFDYFVYVRVFLIRAGIQVPLSHQIQDLPIMI